MYSVNSRTVIITYNMHIFYVSQCGPHSLLESRTNSEVMTLLAFAISSPNMAKIILRLSFRS